MSRLFGNIKIGMLLILIDINIGVFDIIPDFIGYFLLASAAAELNRRTKDASFRNVKYIAGFLMIVSIVNILVPTKNFGLGVHMNSAGLAMSVVTMLAIIHLYYYLYNGMLGMVETSSDVTFNNKLLLDRNINIYVNLVITLLISLSPYLTWIYENGVYMFLFIIVGLILNIIAIINVNSMKTRMSN